MIDAGMMRARAKNLPLAEKGIKLVFLAAEKISIWTRALLRLVFVGNLFFIVEVEDQKASRLIDLNHASFPGNPLMPIF